MQISQVRVLFTITAAAGALLAADFRPPAGDRYALSSLAGTVLPGGRFIKPFGLQIETGPGTFGLAVSPKGTVATADTGFERFGVSVIDPPGKNQSWSNLTRARHLWARTPGSRVAEMADPDWTGVSSGIAFESEKTIWVSEGASGRIRQIDAASGDRRKAINLNDGEWRDSFTADLVWDSAHRLLLAVDRANARVVLVDGRTGRVLSSVRLEGVAAIALSPDGSRAYAAESHAVCVIDIRDPAKAAIVARIPASSPAGVLALADRVYIANETEDSITVATADGKAMGEIPLRIPSLEQFRGVEPAGMAYDPLTKWLLVAEAGINAVGVIDTEKGEVIGHLPAGWGPVKVAIAGDRVYVANTRGRGTGPNLRRPLLELGEASMVHRGSVTTFVMPDASEVLRQTGTVFAYNGFVPYMRDAAKMPAGIRHVVLIVKESGTFDEVLGDVIASANGRALGTAALARFGMHGRAIGGKMQFSVQDAAITPNQHSVARRWALDDNFYVDGDTAAEAARWLEGGAGNPVNLWEHLRRAGVAFRNFNEEFSAKGPAQVRADRIIAEIEKEYGKEGGELPRFLCIHLPGDGSGEPRPQEGYPYGASYVEDNDLAAGRILEYLSRSRWWREMTVFVTNGDATEGLDHVDAHRTVLLAAGPWVKRNYLSRTNSSFAGLRRTILELLGAPPLKLADAAGASLRDLFTEEPDFEPYTAVQPDVRIFDPAKAAAAAR